MTKFGLLMAAVLCCPLPAFGQDGALLREQLLKTYPSLAYVDRYRQAFPAEVQGSDRLWKSDRPPSLDGRRGLVEALIGLADQHVSLGGKKASPIETLGVMFRSATDGSMSVWRVFDAKITAVKPGDVVISIDGVATKRSLERTAANTFGGNRRSRAAEAALDLGLGSRAVHETAGLGPSVKLSVESVGQKARDVVLAYAPMGEDAALALTEAVNRADLPPRFTVGGARVASIRLGNFAPQYDSVFTEASDAAAKVAGTTDDQAMVAGFCAVVRKFIATTDEIASESDVLVLDVRGNMGGFVREARLMAAALTAATLPRSFDVFRSDKPGVVRLQEQQNDPSCGRLSSIRPLVVLTDAGTRSSGEFIAAWLWSAGAVVAGERTIGAGGGRDSASQGFDLPGSGYAVRLTGNFTVLDSTGTLRSGEVDEQSLIDTVATDKFAPSRERYYSFQAAGVRPDISVETTRDDLLDGGVAEVGRVLVAMKSKGLWPRK